MPKAKKRTFSVTKVVKANARDRVGMPPAEKVLPNTKDKATAAPRYKETMADLLAKSED